jgi:DNA-binding FadR family transcriptional regulator
MAELLPGMLQISAGSDETLSHQLTRQLRSLITSGRLVPGQRLRSSSSPPKAISAPRPAGGRW